MGLAKGEMKLSPLQKVVQWLEWMSRHECYGPDGDGRASVPYLSQRVELQLLAEYMKTIIKHDTTYDYLERLREIDKQLTEIEPDGIVGL